MQDKSYAIAIVIILGICALGMYVAISGFLNNVPLTATSTPRILVTQLTPTGATETISAAATIPIIPSVTPTPTASTPPTSTIPLPTLAPRPVIPATATRQAVQSCGFQFCARGGPPDDVLGPAGNPCPRYYIWGRIFDLSGQGVPNMRIRVKLPTGEVSEDKLSKDKPDIVGKYDIPAMDGTYIIWLIDNSGQQASPQVSISTAAYSGTGNCPTRLDFVQTR